MDGHQLKNRHESVAQKNGRAAKWNTENEQLGENIQRSNTCATLSLPSDIVKKLLCFNKFNKWFLT